MHRSGNCRQYGRIVTKKANGQITHKHHLPVGVPDRQRCLYGNLVKTGFFTGYIFLSPLSRCGKEGMSPRDLTAQKLTANDSMRSVVV